MTRFNQVFVRYCVKRFPQFAEKNDNEARREAIQ